MSPSNPTTGQSAQVRIGPPPIIRSWFKRMIYRGLDRWGVRRSGRYDPRRTLVVAGSPRGGTTWLAEVIAKTRGHLLLWEPLEPSAHPTILQTLGIGHDHYVAPDAQVLPGSPDWALYQYLGRVLAGKAPLSEYLRTAGLGAPPLWNMLTFRRYVAKFVRGNLLLHWMLRTFGLRGVLIVRHPCAVVASKMHFAWEGALGWKDRWVPFLERHAPEKVELARSIRTGEEVLALDWAVTNLIPLRQPRPHPWLLVAYEDLAERAEEWGRVCDYFHCPLPSQTVIRQASSTFKQRGSYTTPAGSVEKWKRHLTGGQIARILRVCMEMGMDFYDETPYPQRLDRYR